MGVLESPRPLTSALDGPFELRRLSAQHDATAFTEHVVRGGDRLRAHSPGPTPTRTPNGARG
jgi:hypothetical protein